MAVARCYAVFASAIGDCAVAWNDAGLRHVWLPAADRSALERTIARTAPRARAAAPHGEVAEALAALVRLLAGERVALDDVRLDVGDTDPFDARVYAAARTVPAGSVVTYGELAGRVAGAASARAVGQALGRNPWPLVVPCHRIVAAGHALGGFSAPGGAATKQRLLAIERAHRGGDAGDLFDGCDPAPRVA